jgi:DNA-binding MarR family transcriptional regulator
MDYSLMAKEMLKKMAIVIRSNSHKKFGEFVEGEMFVLNHLTYKSEKVLPSELATVMNTSTSRIAAILNSLERKGWIIREIDETDRRRILVSLTSAGKQFVHEKHQAIKDMTENVLRRLGEEDTQELLRLLDRLTGIYQDLMPPEKKACMPKEGCCADTLNENDKGEPQP